MPPAAGQVLGKLMQFVWVPVAKVIFAAGFFLFLWGLVNFLWHLEDGSGHEEGKQHMFWGIVGMFIMVSFSAVIVLIMNTLGINNSSISDPSRADTIQVVPPSFLR